jgi:hypothetical protein
MRTRKFRKNKTMRRKPRHLRKTVKGGASFDPFAPKVKRRRTKISTHASSNHALSKLKEAARNKILESRGKRIPAIPSSFNRRPENIPFPGKNEDQIYRERQAYDISEINKVIESTNREYFQRVSKLSQQLFQDFPGFVLSRYHNRRHCQLEIYELFNQSRDDKKHNGYTITNTSLSFSIAQCIEIIYNKMGLTRASNPLKFVAIDSLTREQVDGNKMIEIATECRAFPYKFTDEECMKIYTYMFNKALQDPFCVMVAGNLSYYELYADSGITMAEFKPEGAELQRQTDLIVHLMNESVELYGGMVAPDKSKVQFVKSVLIDTLLKGISSFGNSHEYRSGQTQLNKAVSEDGEFPDNAALGIHHVYCLSSTRYNNCRITPDMSYIFVIYYALLQDINTDSINNSIKELLVEFKILENILVQLPESWLRNSIMLNMIVILERIIRIVLGPGLADMNQEKYKLHRTLIGGRINAADGDNLTLSHIISKANGGKEAFKLFSFNNLLLNIICQVSWSIHNDHASLNCGFINFLFGDYVIVPIEFCLFWLYTSHDTNDSIREMIGKGLPDGSLDGVKAYTDILENFTISLLASQTHGLLIPIFSNTTRNQDLTAYRAPVQTQKNYVVSELGIHTSSTTDVYVLPLSTDENNPEAFTVCSSRKDGIGTPVTGVETIDPFLRENLLILDEDSESTFAYMVNLPLRLDGTETSILFKLGKQYSVTDTDTDKVIDISTVNNHLLIDSLHKVVPPFSSTGVKYTSVQLLKQNITKQISIFKKSTNFPILILGMYEDLLDGLKVRNARCSSVKGIITLFMTKLFSEGRNPYPPDVFPLAVSYAISYCSKLYDNNQYLFLHDSYMEPGDFSKLPINIQQILSGPR